ncbi:transcription termination factor 1 isoform X2 [Bombina bombina]|uniref:transcription termination factor 1 isoform X2 n=1 Tax=Bombina bombina TaxID=8345 RepID=UPI00235A6844|nr:transcription termination factor 1 isoform X2 [Bombina bombina]
MAQLSNRDFSRINGYVLSPKMKNKKTQSERQNIEPKSEPEDEVPITPIEEDHSMAQGKGTRTHDKLTEGMDSLPLAKKKRKKKNRLYDSVLENGLVLPSESNGDIDATLGNLNVPSKKKKHRRAEDSLQNSSCCVGEASPTNQSDPVNPKKKKKKKKHCTNDEQNEEEPLFAEHLSEEEEPLSSKKKSKKKHHVHDARHNAEGDKSFDHSDADLQNSSKKKKKTKHYRSDDQSHGEETSFTEQLVVSNALNSKKKKKKKKHPPENDQDQEEDAGFTEQPDVEDPLFTKKKRKKEKHKAAEDPSQWEDTLLVDLPDTEDQLRSKKKKKKRHYNNHNEEKQGEGDPASAPQTNAEDHFYTKKKKKKNKTDLNNEQEQVDGGVSLVEQPNLEAPVHTKKKKKRRHDTSDEQSKGEGDQTCSGQADTEGEPQPKKKKNKKQQDEDEDQGEEDAAFSAQLDVLSPLDSVKKRKKKKSVENPELHQKEDGLLEAELASAGHSKHKKKNHRESVLESSANINESESPAERPAEKRKQKKHKSLQGTLAKENISEVAEPITEEGDAQCEPRLSKKSRKRDKSVAADPDLSEPATEDKVEKSVSKKKKRKKNLDEATSEHDPVPKSPAATKPTAEGDMQDLRAQQENVQRHRIALSQEMTHNLTSSKPITKKKRKRSSEKCEDILATLSQNDIDLLKEFFPKLMSLKKSTITTLIHEDLERIREAKKKGITYLKGRFTTEENNQLRKNVAEFMTMTEIDSAEKLFHSQRYPDQREWIEQKKKELNFRYRMAENIARPVHEVCHRGVKMFDESSNKGRYTEEEVENLKKYWTMYGNKWKVLGDLVGRNNATLQLKASQLRQEVVRGSWTKKEINRMIKAIKSFVLSPNCSNNPESSQEPDVIPKRKLYQGIPWVQIEKKVKTRNWSQCKTKWTEVLLSRMNNGTNVLQGAAGLELSINFIKWLHTSGIKDSGQVNWAELADHLGNIPPMVVQVHFYKLKSKYVPNWKNVAFEEIVHRLYKDGIPQLEALLLTMRTQTTLQPQVIEIKNEFSVAEIFRTYTSEEKHMIMRSKKNGP